ncbi:MAG: hypothetical protein ACRDLF_01685 [Solirubrobacteraceae bacterium]
MRLLSCLTSAHATVSGYHAADHPHGKSPITRPRMHVAANVEVGDRWLGKVHLPTGMVGLEQVVALAIVEFGVEPLRDDWERLTDEADAR